MIDMSSTTVKQVTNIPKNKTLKIKPGIFAIDNPSIKQRCPNGQHWNEKTQKCEPIVKSAKKLYLGCSRDYVPTVNDIPRINELKEKTAQELRDIISDLTDIPRGQKNQILGARRVNEMINLIVCIETKKKLYEQASEETVEVPEETLEVPEETVAVPEETVEVPEETVEVPEETVEVPEETLEVPEETLEVPEETVEVPEETVEVTEQTVAVPEIVIPLKAPLEKDTKEYNDYLFQHEKAENEYNKETTEYDFLYPTLDDSNFNIKIASRKEFNDTKYDGEIHDIREYAKKLCDADFEIMPHQLFIKNFLSFQTPYNSLLLYHGLGTGKTCSAIGVAEEMRKFMRQVGIKQRIIVVASPNVQNNFRLQLFDERKLLKEGEFWSLNTCIGSELLSEVNTTNMRGLTKENIITKIKRTINQYYDFMGYIEFTNYIEKKIDVPESTGYSEKERRKMYIDKIRRVFSNRLIIIDEAHNIRMTDDNKKRKKTTTLLMEVAKNAENMRLLLLSATPMYNSYKEIIWLTNILNLVDKRSTIREEDVFDKDGNFLPARKTKEGRDLEGGRELLQRKLTGYISYVRGENPYTFPYRIYPQVFSPENAIDLTNYPLTQMNSKPVDEQLNYVPVFTTNIGEYQEKCYDYIMFNLRTNSFKSSTERDMPSFENMESFGYNTLQQPLEALNMVYPNKEFDNLLQEYIQHKQEIANLSNEQIVENVKFEPKSLEIISNMVGKRGLAEIMTSKKIEKKSDTSYSLRYDFDYKPEVLLSYGRIFNKENIGKYSSKISNICDSVMNSKGIIMIYSQFIDGGIVPVALALEELGFTRFGSASHTKSLFKKQNPPIEQIDAVTMKKRSEFFANIQERENEVFHPAKYLMITGDQSFSPNNLEDINYITNDDNRNGEKVKVVLITKAGAEGLDFKNIRQIHILEPWYNMNRIEQMIGRGVRNLSHCKLPFEERNVEIYLHGTLPRNQEEPADMYVYRFAEKKAIQIGKVTRLLKEIAVDCILHIEQTNFTVEKLISLAKNQNIVLKLSSGKSVDFKIGDKPFTDICDYMDNCNFTCSPNAQINENNVLKNTYSTDFIKMNYSTIVKRIRQLFREQSFYKRNDLINSINILKTYPVEQIDYALTHFINNKNEYLTDYLGRTGYLINRENFYAFQPIEINDENASIYERTNPVDYKRTSLFLELPTNVKASLSSDEDLNRSIAETTTTTLIETNLSKIYNEIIQQIRGNLDIAFSPEIHLLTKEDKENWFKNMNNVLYKLTDYHKISIETIMKYVLYHNLDILSFENRFNLVKYLFKDENAREIEIENLIKDYFQEKIVISENKEAKGIVLVNNEDKWRIYVQNKQNSIEWNEIDTENYEQFKTDLLNKLVLDNEKRGKYNEMIGFMTTFREREIVFKTKVLTKNKNNKGVYCEIVGKEDVIKKLNTLLGSVVYDENFITKQIKVNVKDERKGTITEKTIENGIYKQGLCVILEILLRYYNDTAVNGKLWFLDTEKAKINQFVDYKK